MGFILRPLLYHEKVKKSTFWQKLFLAAARDHALLLLSQRMHSQKELRDKLIRKDKQHKISAMQVTEEELKQE